MYVRIQTLVIYEIYVLEFRTYLLNIVFFLTLQETVNYKYFLNMIESLEDACLQLLVC